MQTRRASATWWSASRTVAPGLPGRAAGACPRCSAPGGSTPAKGSSQTRTEGERVIARASSSRRRSPPESSPARTSRRCSSPTRAARRAADRRRAARRAMRRKARGSARTVRSQRTLGPWGTYPTPARARFQSGQSVTSCVRQAHGPAVAAGVSPTRTRKRVDLPAPEGPSTPSTSPAPRVEVHAPQDRLAPAQHADARGPTARPPRRDGQLRPLGHRDRALHLRERDRAVAISMRAESAVSQPWPRVSFTPPRRSSTCLVRSSSADGRLGVDAAHVGRHAARGLAPTSGAGSGRSAGRSAGRTRRGRPSRASPFR